MKKLFCRNNNLSILIAGIFAIIIGMGVARFAFTGLVPEMQEDYVSIKFIGILASLNFVGYLAGSIFSIFLKDMKQKVLFFRLGIIFSILTTFVLGLSSNNSFWLISRIIAGFSSAMCLVVGSAIVMAKLKMDNKTKAMGIHFSGIGFSILVTDLISRISLFFDFSWQETWVILSVIAIFLSLYAIYILSFDKDIQKSEIKQKFDFSVFNFFTILVVVSYFTAGVGFVVQATFLPDIVNSLPGLKGYGSITWTLVGLAGIPSCIIWMILAHKFGTLNMIIISMFLQIIGILIPVFTNNIFLNLFSGILYGGTFIGLVALFLNLGGQLSKKNPVILMGVLTASYGIGQVVAPLYSVYFFEKYKNYNYSLCFTAFIVFIGILLLMYSKKISKEKYN